MKKQKMKTFNLIPLFAFMMMLLASCGKEIFNPIRKQTTDTTNPVTSQSTATCSQYTLVRPEVDILFVWDNSTSMYFTKDEVKKSLNGIVNTVSSRFDHHIVMAPLLVPAGGDTNHQMKLISRTENNLSAEALAMRVNPPKPSDALNFSPVTGGKEAGLQRISDILVRNRSNGVFRPNAYTIIVIAANQDDNSWSSGAWSSGEKAVQYVDNRVHEILCMRGNYTPPAGRDCNNYNPLNSKMMRLISIVPQIFNSSSTCKDVESYRNNGVYEKASSDIFLAPYNNGNPSNSTIESYPSVTRATGALTLFDTVNICAGQLNYKNPANVFDTVNNVIQDTVINHVYRYWPVAGAGVPVNEYTIRVASGTGTYYSEIPSSISITRDPNGKNDLDSSTNTRVNGWRYIGDTFANTRFLPTAGEPFQGHLIELFGDAKVTYPTCLIVSSDAPVEYYGYVYVGTAKPLEDKIELRINGTLISKSSTNGWTLDPTHYPSGRNIKIVSPTDASPAYPAVTKPAGYYLKVHGSAIYSNSASVDVRWLPTSQSN